MEVLKEQGSVVAANSSASGKTAVLLSVLCQYYGLYEEIPSASSPSGLTDLSVLYSSIVSDQVGSGLKKTAEVRRRLKLIHIARALYLLALNDGRQTPLTPREWTVMQLPMKGNSCHFMPIQQIYQMLIEAKVYITEELLMSDIVARLARLPRNYLFEGKLIGINDEFQLASASTVGTDGRSVFWFDFDTAECCDEPMSKTEHREGKAAQNAAADERMQVDAEESAEKTEKTEKTDKCEPMDIDDEDQSKAERGHNAPQRTRGSPCCPCSREATLTCVAAC